MKRSKFSDTQIISILKQGEVGLAVPDICREHGISSAIVALMQRKRNQGFIPHNNGQHPHPSIFPMF